MPSNFSQRLCHLFRVCPIMLLLCAGLGAANAQIKPNTERNTLYLIAGGNHLPGASDGVGPAAQFHEPRGIGRARLPPFRASLFVVDSRNHTVRQITPEGMVTTMAGRKGICGKPDDFLSNPIEYMDGLNKDSLRHFYSRYFYNLKTRFCMPMGIAVFGDELFVTDSYFGALRRLRLDIISQHEVWTIRDDISQDLGTSGDAMGIAVGPALIAYMSSTKKNIIISKNYFGVFPDRLTTIAGAEGPCGSADGAGSDARFCHPEAVALNRGTQNLYVADTRNHTIRQITLAGGVVSTIAGTPGKCGNADGVGAAALFCNPVSIAVDEATGDLYVADLSFSLIRKITPDKTVSTVVGGPRRFLINELGPLPGVIDSPVGVAVIGPGQLAITTLLNQVLGVNF